MNKLIDRLFLVLGALFLLSSARKKEVRKAHALSADVIFGHLLLGGYIVSSIEGKIVNVRAGPLMCAPTGPLTNVGVPPAQNTAEFALVQSRQLPGLEAEALKLIKSSSAANPVLLKITTWCCS